MKGIVQVLSLVAMLGGGAVNGQEGRIIGGTEVPKGDYEWFASLQEKKKGSAFCGGSLISKNYVLTAAHCVYGSEGPDRVVMGIVGIKEDGVTRGVKRVIWHPAYDANTVENDLALLELDSEVTEIAPVSLGRSSPGENVVTKAIGFGLTKENNMRPSNKLMQVDLPIVSYATCTAKGAYSKSDIIDRAMICAGYREGGKDSCNGDSGGPLFLDDSSPVQVGIVSWGDGCAQRLKYGVYTRVSSYIAWIESITGPLGSSSGSTPSPTPVGTATPTTSVSIETWNAEESFCLGKLKEKKCAKFPARCGWDGDSCHTILVKPPTAAPTSFPTDQYYSSEDYCVGLNAKQCRREPYCEWENGECHQVGDYSSEYSYSSEDFEAYCSQLNAKQCKRETICEWNNSDEQCEYIGDEYSSYDWDWCPTKRQRLQRRKGGKKKN